MNRIAQAPSSAEVLIISAVASAFPPVLAGAVPDGWNGDASKGCVPEFTVDVSAAGAASITAVNLHAAFPVAGAIADTTFTASGATLTDNSHGLITGDGPVRLTTTDTLPAGLALATDYWIIYLSANTYSLATSRALAFAGTAVTTTDAGTGTHTLSDTADTMLIKWRDWGVLSSAPTLSLRQGYAVVCDHDPRAVAYGVTWTGTAANAVRAAMITRSPR